MLYEVITLIGDCSGVDVVKVTASAIASPIETLSHGTGGNDGDNNSTDLSKDYDANAEVIV